jgi:hypothetical protein
MPVTALVAAARAGDAARVAALLAAGADPHATCLVEPTQLRRQETPLYATTALFEACRARCAASIAALLAAGADPNQPATPLGLTPLADAVARCDEEAAAALLAGGADPGAAPGALAAHPALLAAAAGCTPMLRTLLRGAPATLPRRVEPHALRAAAAGGRPAALALLQGACTDAHPLAELTPGARAARVQREFGRIDRDGNGYVDARELRALLAALGVRLGAGELREAFAALDTAGDGRARVEEVGAWLLGEAGWREAGEEAGEVAGGGGYAGGGGGGGGAAGAAAAAAAAGSRQRVVLAAGGGGAHAAGGRGE